MRSSVEGTGGFLFVAFSFVKWSSCTTFCSAFAPQPHLDVPLARTGVLINLLGLGSTLLGIQTLVGVLVAKTLSNATANPFVASSSAMYNPVLALDVFLVQAATNTLLGHLISLACSLWLLNILGEGRGLRFQVGTASASHLIVCALGWNQAS